MSGESKAYLCDLSALMIASEKCHMCRISSLQQHQESECLQAVVSPVHKVTHEYVVCAWDLSTGSKELEQVMELAMYVSTHLPSVHKQVGSVLATARNKICSAGSNMENKG